MNQLQPHSLKKYRNKTSYLYSPFLFFVFIFYFFLDKGFED